MNIHREISLIGVVIATGLSMASGSQAASDSAAQSTMAHTAHDATGLVRAVRQSTRRFLYVSQAVAAGYGPFLGCTSGHDAGAMGLHYVNGGLIGDGALDAEQPEVLVYEPMADGRLRLVAVEYVVVAEAWHANNETPPVLMGQLFHFNGSPNRYGLPAHYALHVWAWKPNPKGMFSNFNPRVTCERYAPDA
jgi:hypothetical protein